MADGRDPFDDVVFDETFVRAADRIEPSAEERLADQRRAEAALRVPGPSVAVRPKRWRPPVWLVLAVALAAVIWLAVVRSDGDELGASPFGGTDGTFVLDGEISRYPSPPSDLSDEPLGQAPVPPSGGAYEFVATTGDGDPIRWDPCRPIRIVVSGASSVTGADALLAEAIAEVSAASGLVLEVEGVTDEIANPDRPPVQDRYGDRWAPVLVAWTDSSAVPDLAGDVAGLGGAQPILDRRSGHQVYVTGGVYLDAPDFRRILSTAGGTAAARGVVVHELGHLLGLAHVSTQSELMYAGASDRNTLGLGDREGLFLLGRGPCVPSL